MFFQLQYVLTDASPVMDALVRNEGERDILLLLTGLIGERHAELESTETPNTWRVSAEEGSEGIVRQVFRAWTTTEDLPVPLREARRNFYRRLKYYPKVTGVIFRWYGAEPEEGEARTIVRKEFARWLTPDPVVSDPEAVIDLIAPVLKGGKFAWKGLYQGEVIEFNLKDNAFRETIRKREIEFVSGMALKGVLTQRSVLEKVTEVLILDETLKKRKKYVNPKREQNQLSMEFD